MCLVHAQPANARHQRGLPLPGDLPLLVLLVLAALKGNLLAHARHAQVPGPEQAHVPRVRVQLYGLRALLRGLGVARVAADLLARLRLAQRVNAARGHDVHEHQSPLGRLDGHDADVLGDVGEVPGELLALELMAQRLACAEVSHLQLWGQGLGDLDDIRVLVHPDLRGPVLVHLYDFHGHRVDLALKEGGLAEDVAHVRAGNLPDAAAAHPSPEAHFHVLAAVELHAQVVAAQVQEEDTVNGEVAPGHDG
mmetsp:Transcript_127327/g.396303  ORF Transcript_127327/g.396303 Transcript_127327/m.396303 type:complete len:251 (-) Transcript_127327:1269-2021(-)